MAYYFSIPARTARPQIAGERRQPASIRRHRLCGFHAATSCDPLKALATLCRTPATRPRPRASLRYHGAASLLAFF